MWYGAFGLSENQQLSVPTGAPLHCNASVLVRVLLFFFFFSALNFFFNVWLFPLLPLFPFFQNLAFKVLALHVQTLQLVLASLSSHEPVFLVPWPGKALPRSRGCQNPHRIVQLEHCKPQRQEHDQ